MNVFHKVTLQSLKRNKTRTVVTIIGVILSMALLTAVTTLISSLQNYLVEATIVSTGDWQAEIDDVDKTLAQQISKRKDIEESAIVYGEGYALLEDGQNEYKPYLYVCGMDEQAFDMLSVHLVSGRLPENDGELVISEHIINDGGVSYKVGDTITLDIGSRVSEGYEMSQSNPFEPDGTEILEVFEQKTYTVVGICQRLGMEDYSAPGYTVVTKINQEDIPADGSLTVYYKLKNAANIYTVTEEIAGNTYGYSYNNDLLRFMGISNDDTFLTVLYSLCGILFALIIFGSVALIYNAFAISVSQRSQQFGLLSSVGATRKQLARSVLFEAFFISCIGIPIGLLVGIGGIGATLYIIKDMFDSLVSIEGVSLHLSVSFMAVAIAVVVGILTVFISAYIPARRASRMSAMDAIRKADDVKIKAKKVKTSKITRKLFGLEGELALKNSKRNRRRYRSTILSLFMSIVLFIGASAFGMYLTESSSDVVQDVSYDIFYSNTNADDVSTEALFHSILNIESVEGGAWYIRSQNANILIGEDRLTETGRDYYASSGEGSDNGGVAMPVYVFIMDDETFTGYAQSLGIDPQEYLNAAELKAIAVDNSYLYNYQTGRYNQIQLMNHNLPAAIQMYQYTVDDQTGEQTTKNDSILDITINTFAEEAPMGADTYADSGVVLLVLPESAANIILADDLESFGTSEMAFVAKDHVTAVEEIETLLTDQGQPTGGLYDVTESLQASKNLLTIISIFSYGFIILISLITIANVFNTISTNLHLRQREFAMLQSVGMTPRGFKRMMNYECILYGVKALFYGLPTAFLIVFLIYRSVTGGVDTALIIPWNSVIISVVSVFLVVFITMLYSMREIKRRNVIDALKNENL